MAPRAILALHEKVGDTLLKVQPGQGGLRLCKLNLIKLYKNALVPLILDPSRWGRSRCEQQMIRKKKSEVIATEMDAIILSR